MSPSIGSGRPLLGRWRRIPGPPRDRVKARLLRLYLALERRYGPRRPGPERTPYEIAVGVILAGSSPAREPADAVRALRARGFMDPARLAAATEGDVERAGATSRPPARRLRAFTRWLLERFGGRFNEMRRSPLAPLRQDLLTVEGLGAETADAILLHAGGRPVFPVDHPARRVLGRHRLIDPRAASETLRAFVEAHLPSDRELFGHYHTLLVAVSAEHCGTVPRCTGCPLRFDLRGQPPATARGKPGDRSASRQRGPVIPRARRGRSAPGRPGARRRQARPGHGRDRPSP